MTTRPEAPSDSYLTGWTAMVNAYVGEGPAAALAVVEELIVRFPERAGYLGYFRTGLLCKFERIDEALGTTRDTVAAGGWWSRLKLADPDLAPLAETGEFAALRAEMNAREDAALAEAAQRQPVLVVREAKGAARAAVVVLHMYGVGAAETAEIWRGVERDGVTVVAAESRLWDGDGRPCWDDDTQTRADVANAIAAARSIVPGAPLVLAGGSQGAGVAGRLVLSGAAPEARGFIAVAGSPDADSLAGSLPDAVARDVRCYLLAGGADHLVSSMQQRTHDALRGAGLTCSLVLVPDLPHVYPPDWPDLAAGAVAFCTQS